MIDSPPNRVNHAAFRPEHAFVVEFADVADAAPDRLTGRVEHVVSGRATRFASTEELLAFVTYVVARPRRRLDGGS